MKNIIRKIFMVLVLCSATVLAFAQTKIQGKVTDSQGAAVVGAVVMLDGSNTVASVTDANGRYKLTIPSSAVKAKLKVSCIGFKETSAPADQMYIDFVLEEDNEQLEEVVVVGYGYVKKSDLTGSVASVKINEGEASRATSLAGMLSGKASGVQVLQNSAAPDAGVSVRIRGLSTFNGSSEPLYVVDGIMINTSSIGGSVMTKGDTSTEETNGLLGLNPQDIASIEVLKDASATAIYGAMGSNGVVLITTKSAVSERPTVNFSAGVDVSQVTKRYPVLDFNEYLEFLNYRADYILKDSYWLRGIYEDPVAKTGLMVTGQDWQEYVLHTAVSQRYFFSVSGKPNKTAYNFSFGYSDKQGIVKTTGLKQLTTRLNIDKQIGKKFKMGVKVNLAYLNSDMTQSTGSGTMTAATSLTRSMLSYHPYRSNRILEEEYNDDESIDQALKSSPDRWIDRKHFDNYRKEFRATPSLYMQYDIIKGLNFKTTFGGDYRNQEMQKFKSSFINWSADGSICGTSTYESLYWNWDNTLTFSKRFKNAHNLYGVLGASTRQSSSTASVIEGWNIKEYKSNVQSINSAPNTSSIYSESMSSTQSFFLRAVYNYKERYSLTATCRLDGSSKFQGANKWATFPSLAAAWNINREKWFKNNVLTKTKLRAGWGRVGNQAVSNYQTLSNFSLAKTPTHDLGNDAEYTVGMYPSNIANPNLKWETNEQINIGLDLGFWNDRLTFEAEAYIKNTYDLLQSKLIPRSSGFYSTWVNEGNIQNKGLEFTFTAVPVKVRDFTWDLNGNISLNRNKVVSISDTNETKKIFMRVPTSSDPAEIEASQKEVRYFYGSQVGGGNYMLYPANIYMEGYPMGLFYGFKADGVVGVGQTGPAMAEGAAPRTEGYIRYVDCNGNGYIDDDDRTIIGDPNPDFTFGFGTTFTYKRFALTANFSGSYGNDILNINEASDTQTDQSYRNIIKDAWYKAWTPLNQDTKYAAVGFTESTDYRKITSNYIYDGSYLRLANLSLSYDFVFKKKSILKNLNIGVTAQNVFVWTKYPGWDPEVNSFGNDIKRMGCDLGSYPSCRTYSFDVKFTF